MLPFYTILRITNHIEAYEQLLLCIIYSHIDEYAQSQKNFQYQTTFVWT